MNNSFLPNLEAGILAKWQELQSNKLLAKGLAENLTHIAKKLHSNNPVILIGVIMRHLNNMSQYKITSLTIIDLMCQLSQILSWLLFYLNLNTSYL